MARAGEGVKLHLGSGTHPARLPDWCDADLPWRGVIEPTVYADGFALPFPDDTFEALLLSHVLEHIERALLPAFLAEARRVMRPHAAVAVVGPALDLAIEQGEPESILRAIDTLGEGPGAHKWVATVANTLEVVRAAFWCPEVVPASAIALPDWPNPSGAAWQVAVLARA